MALQYNPLDNDFTVFESVENPTVSFKMPLMPTPIDLSDNFYKINEENIPMAKQNENIQVNFNSNHQEETPQYNTQQNSNYSEKIPTSKGSQTLSNLIDEVSNEEGFEGLKNQEIKNILMLQAKRESDFNPTARAKGSTASGYFQFIDGTRKQFSSSTREEFMKNPKEQIRTAYKYYNWIHSLPNAKLLSQKGYNNAQITALGWWYPDSMRMVLNGNTNFSKGGYSIKKALETYK